jgi:DNA invertase Pin-like site-specific DNA recombinase
MVVRLDRLARSVEQLIETAKDPEGCEIIFRSLAENIDTMTAGGRPPTLSG